MNISEDNLISWSKGPSQTEIDKCNHAESMIRKALRAYEELESHDFTVFAQGSYRARTNVRQNSDVDVCVRYNTTFFPKYPDGKTRENFGNYPGTMSFTEYKNMVHRALANYFGADGVTRGNKAFDVHANSYRVDADVVPTFEYRWYTGKFNNDGSHHFYSGVAFDPDSGNRIVNWPQQTYDKGVERNSETSRRYKRVIRILKRLRDRMTDENITAAQQVPSFLIECIVWNGDTAVFSNDAFEDILRELIADAWKRTRDIGDWKNWAEVNQMKSLFRDFQPWTRQQAHEFLEAAWHYIGYS